MHEVEDAKAAIKNTWYALHARNKIGNYIWDDEGEIHGLLNNIILVTKSEPGFASKHSKRILSLIDNWDKGNIKDRNRWHRDMTESLAGAMQQLNIYIQKDSIRRWGDFWFSKIFPNTFSYLEEYIPTRFPRYFQSSIPDVKVNVISSSQKRTNHFLEGDSEAIYSRSRIYLNLTLYFPQTVPSNVDEVNKCFRYMDTIKRLRLTLVHEYEHYIQDLAGQKYLEGIPRPISWIMKKLGLYDSKAFIPSYISIEVIGKLKASNARFKSFYDVYASAVRDAEPYLKQYEGYDFSASELDARLAEYIFIFTEGKSTEDAIENVPPFSIQLIECREMLLSCRRTLDEAYAEKSIADATSADEPRKTALQEKVDHIRAEIAFLEQYRIAYTQLLNSAQAIAREILAKRKRLESELADTNQ